MALARHRINSAFSVSRGHMPPLALACGRLCVGL